MNLILNDENENEILKYECTKSLVLLGDWNENVCIFLKKYLKDGSSIVKSELLRIIMNGRNPQLVNKVM